MKKIIIMLFVASVFSFAENVSKVNCDSPKLHSKFGISCTLFDNAISLPYGNDVGCRSKYDFD